MPTQTINLNNTTPAAPSGALNIEWQADAASLDPSVARNVSAYYSAFTGDSGSGGAMGLVPAPAAGDAAAGKVLKADGTWYVAPGGMTNPMNSEGDLIVGGASGAAERLAAGTAGQVLQTNGATAAPSWVTPSGGSSGGSGALTLIQEIVTSGSATSVSFASFSSAYRDLVLRIRGRGNGATIVPNILIQFNGDTGSNYAYEDAHFYGGGTSWSQTDSTSSICVGELPGASATALYAGGAQTVIFDYRGSTFYKQTSSPFCSSLGPVNTSWAYGVGILGGTWKNTTPITSLLVFLSTGGFVDGSVVSLYGSV